MRRDDEVGEQEMEFVAKTTDVVDAAARRHFAELLGTSRHGEHAGRRILRAWKRADVFEKRTRIVIRRGFTIREQPETTVERPEQRTRPTEHQGLPCCRTKRHEQSPPDAKLGHQTTETGRAVNHQYIALATGEITARTEIAGRQTQ